MVKSGISVLLSSSAFAISGQEVVIEFLDAWKVYNNELFQIYEGIKSCENKALTEEKIQSFEKSLSKISKQKIRCAKLAEQWIKTSSGIKADPDIIMNVQSMKAGEDVIKFGIGIQLDKLQSKFPGDKNVLDISKKIIQTLSLKENSYFANANEWLDMLENTIPLMDSMDVILGDYFKKKDLLDSLRQVNRLKQLFQIIFDQAGPYEPAEPLTPTQSKRIQHFIHMETSRESKIANGLVELQSLGADGETLAKACIDCLHVFIKN